MTLPTSQRFGNAVVGQMGAGADINVFSVDTTCKFPIGQGFVRSDGNKFRYVSFDAAVPAGKLVAPVFANSGKTTFDNAIIAPASAVQVASEYPTLPGQVGSHYVEVTVSSIAANQYQGGYLITEDASGEGYAYRIKGNTATGNPATGNIRIQLWEPIQVLLTNNTDLTIVPSMYNDVDVASAATNWAVAGVACALSTATSFGWICTHGVWCILQDGAWTGGDQLALSTVVSGAACVYGALTTSVANLTGVQVIGYAVQNGGDTEQGTAYLQLE